MKNVVIIGGGVAGLSAGIFAEKCGYNAIICEKHDKLGGNLTGWQRGGYHIDNCIHWLTGTNKNTALYKTWVDVAMLGGVGVYSPESLYTYKKGDKKLSLFRDINRLEKEMIFISPKDEKKIRSFIADVNTVRGLLGTAGKDRDRKLTFFQAVKYVPRLIKYVNSSVGQFAKRFDNEVIRGFLNCLLTEDFSSLALLGVFATFTGGDGDIPAKGSLAAAKRMEALFIGLGGKVMTKKHAVKINLDGKTATSVSFADGSTLIGDAFIVTADPKTVFPGLIDVDMPRRLLLQYRDKRLERFSCFQCAFAVGSKALPFKGDLIFDLRKKYVGALGAKRLVLREFSHEASFAPEGMNVLQAMVFLGEAASRSFIDQKNDRAAYESRKSYLCEAVRYAIEDNFPELTDRLRPIDSWTPATYHRYVSSDAGTFMGFKFTGGYLPRTIPCGIKGVDNVFLATQWQRAPGGLPTAAEAGKKAVAALERKFAAAKYAPRAERSGRAFKA